MKILLLESIQNLGKSGEIVSVKNGFARNYLFLTNKAARLTKKNKEKFYQQQDSNTKILNNEQNIALQKSDAVRGKILVIEKRSKSDGKLYGSVTEKDIVSLLANELNVKVNIKNVSLNRKIKQIGSYQISLCLHSKIRTKFKIEVI